MAWDATKPAGTQKLRLADDDIRANWSAIDDVFGDLLDAGTAISVTAATINGAATKTGAETLTNKTLTSPVLNTGVSGTAVLDEDDMASDSATHLATQQSIKAYADAVIPSGTIMLFVQTAAPTGWTKSEAHNDKALRVVSGTASTGGSVAFTTAFTDRTVSGTTSTGTIGGTAISVAQMAEHAHYTVANDSSSSTINTSTHIAQTGVIYGGERNYAIAGTSTSPSLGPSESVGGGGTHDHTFTGDEHDHTLDMTVQYVDVIIATKD